jgi:hypothetical protein
MTRAQASATMPTHAADDALRARRVLAQAT